jgi:hypothetical protein
MGDHESPICSGGPVSSQEFLELFREVAMALSKDAGYDPTDRKIEVCLQSPVAVPVSLEEAASRIYAGDDRFPKIVNVGLFAVGDHILRYSVVVAGFPYGAWQDTWNTPEGWGPFHRIVFDGIRNC